MGTSTRSPTRVVEIAEKFVTSKTGRLEDCEDRLHISGGFVAVIDGATSKSDERWGSETSGQIAARLIDQAFSQIPVDCSARQAADLLTKAISDFYESVVDGEITATDPARRATAAVVAFSVQRLEVWLFGDCQALLGDKRLARPTKVDEILAESRALRLELEILAGATIDELREDDVGRQFIMPLLQRQALLQNNPSAGEYWYPAVDGFPIPDEGIVVEPVPSTVDSIVLASDGYPALKPTLGESERALLDVLTRDPLMFREHKTTKGLTSGHVSFDDRTFVKIRLIR